MKRHILIRLSVYELAREKKLLFKTAFAAPVYSSPIFANGVLYIAAENTLYAIQSGASRPASQNAPASNQK